MNAILIQAWEGGDFMPIVQEGCVPKMTKETIRASNMPAIPQSKGPDPAQVAKSGGWNAKRPGHANIRKSG